MKRHLLILLFGLMAFQFANACGVKWSQPKTTPYPDVAGDGTISIWRELGEVVFGQGDDKLSLPLRLNFSSSRERAGLAGTGFYLPLLEAHAIPWQDEDTIKVMMPSGWNNYFRRTDKKASTFKNALGWAGEQKGNKFTIWAECGERIDFVNGRIVRLNTKGKELVWIYSEGKLVEIREGGSAPALRLDYNKEGFLSELKIAGQKYTLAYESRPLVQSVKAIRVIEGLVPALHTLTNAEGTTTYDFDVDKDIYPRLKLSQGSAPERILMWDPNTKLIRSDSVGGWTYQIDVNPNSSTKRASKIQRVGSGSKREYYSNNRAKGIITQQFADGSVKTVSSFVRGKLRGKVRKVVVDDEVQYQASYNEAGKILREKKDNESIQYKYGDNGEALSKSNDKGHTYWKKEYDKQGRIARSTYDNGTVENYHYTPDHNGYEVNTYEENKLVRNEIYDHNGHVVTRNENGKTISYRRDQLGRVLEKQVNGKKWISKYNHIGKKIETTLEGIVTYKLEYLDGNGSTKEMYYDESGTPTRGRIIRNNIDKKIVLESMTNLISNVGYERKYFYDNSGNLVKLLSTRDGTFAYKKGAPVEKSKWVKLNAGQ